MATAAQAETWTDWLDQLDSLQAESAEVTGLGEAREAAQRAENHARYVIRLANQTDAVRFHHSADEADHDTLHRLVSSIASTAEKVQEADGWDLQPRERQQAVAELVRRAGEAAAQLEESRAQVSELEQARAVIDERLEDLEQSAPKASATSLETLRKERDAAAQERDRITRTLDNMTADDSPLAVAREAESTAQERLEEAEALLAMGESSADEVKAAKAEATKAAKALEEQRAEHRRQDAARRGLLRKREQADSRLETLNRAYRQALARVRHADLAKLESELVADLERTTARLHKMAAVYADLEEAEPGSDYGRATVEVKVPHLHHHERAGELNAHGLEITGSSNA